MKPLDYFGDPGRQYIQKSKIYPISLRRMLTWFLLVLGLPGLLLAGSFQPLPGPYEGNVGGFGMDNSNRLYIAGDGGGVFQSSDASGVNWSIFGNNASLPDTVLQSLGVEPSPNTRSDALSLVFICVHS